MKNIAFLLFVLSIPFSLAAQDKRKDLTLEEIWAKRTFIPESVNQVTSMNDGLHYTALDYGKDGAEINQYSYKTGKQVKTIVKASELLPPGSKEPIPLDSYSFNHDESKIMIAAETEFIYRHSTKSNFYIFDLKTRKLNQLSEVGKQRYATFSPASDEVAFVRDNNIFVRNLKSNTEKALTTDGKVNEIINGATDWVYEEEFSFDRAFFWSQDGKKIAYYRFDESNVKEFAMATYGSLYPDEYRFKYPKAGEENSKVKIFIHDFNSEKSLEVNLGKNTDQYIPRILWTADENVLCVERLNRLQNKIDLMLCNVQTQSAGTIEPKIIYSEESKTYIDASDEKVFFLKDKNRFVWLSDRDGWLHFYLYDISGKLISRITNGKWEITNFKGVDENNGLLYYIAAENTATERELYSIKLDGSAKKKLSTQIGFNDAEFSAGYQYYINTHSSASRPPLITLHTSDGKLIRTIQENTGLIATVSLFKVSPKEFFSFTTSDGTSLNGWMIKPPDFDASKKYPVFMTVYGGPGHNNVNNRWEGNTSLWHQFIAQNGYIVACVDNRGTGAKGTAFRTCTYMQLGKLETEDQIESAKYLGTLPFVDKSRIGIQGWSYGGYMSSLCLTKGADYFKAAIAVAPVTTWRFYDTIYTERYMRTPQENPSGYDDNSPINHVEKMRGKYLLIHGTADDNVHFQNSVEMITALVNAGKQFDHFIYPDKNHGIYGGKTRLHLYTLMTNFILENL